MDIKCFQNKKVYFFNHEADKNFYSYVEIINNQVNKN